MNKYLTAQTMWNYKTSYIEDCNRVKEGDHVLIHHHFFLIDLWYQHDMALSILNHMHTGTNNFPPQLAFLISFLYQQTSTLSTILSWLGPIMAWILYCINQLSWQMLEAIKVLEKVVFIYYSILFIKNCRYFT